MIKRKNVPLPKIDLTGRKFGKYLVLKFAGRSESKRHPALWKCRCECGWKSIITGAALLKAGDRARCKSCAGRRNLSNVRFGRLVALECTGVNRYGKITWRCLCKCGKPTTVTAGALLAGTTKSCGCLQADGTRERSTKHGHSKTTKVSPTYHSWQSMKMRCLNPNAVGFSYYGGATPPVTICDRWSGSNGFINFLADLNERPAGTTLGRFGDMGNYEPGACAWQTWAEQGAEKSKKSLVMKVMKLKRAA